MLNEDQLNKLPERITQRLEKVNRHFLELVGKRIQEIGRMSATDIHRIDMIKQVGADMDLIKAELAQITGKNAAEIEEIFHIAAKDSVEFSKTIAGDAFIPYEENEQLQRYVQALAEQSAKDYVNMSQNTAFLAMQGGKKVLTSMARRYTDIIDEAILAVTSGQTDFYSAMRRSIKEMADSGIRTKYSPLKGTAGPAVDYATGYSRRLDTAVRQNILWGVKQCSQGIQDRVGNSYGADGYEIDYHSNPRPSHAKMGGKQYHKGKGITVNGKYFPPFSQVEGLLDDYGCLHRKWPIICGVSVPAHDDEELAELKKLDNVKIEFEGEEYTRYEMSQIQRKIETRIRHAKDRQIIAAAAGDDELRRKEQEKINLLKSKYVKVSAAAGLPMKMERMSVRGYHRVKTVRELKSIVNAANKLYNLGSEEENITAYLRDKPIREFLEKQFIDFKKYISKKEIVVTVPLAKINETTKHYQDNLKNKKDRKNLTIEECQRVVASAKLTLYDRTRDTLKFINDDAYVVLNFDGDIVTAVPQKWRKKYDKYLEDK